MAKKGNAACTTFSLSLFCFFLAVVAEPASNWYNLDNPPPRRRSTAAARVIECGDCMGCRTQLQCRSIDSGATKENCEKSPLRKWCEVVATTTTATATAYANLSVSWNSVSATWTTPTPTSATTTTTTGALATTSTRVNPNTTTNVTITLTGAATMASSAISNTTLVKTMTYASEGEEQTALNTSENSGLPNNTRATTTNVVSLLGTDTSTISPSVASSMTSTMIRLITSSTTPLSTNLQTSVPVTTSSMGFNTRSSTFTTGAVRASTLAPGATTAGLGRVDDARLTAKELPATVTTTIVIIPSIAPHESSVKFALGGQGLYFCVALLPLICLCCVCGVCLRRRGLAAQPAEIQKSANNSRPDVGEDPRLGGSAEPPAGMTYVGNVGRSSWRSQLKQPPPSTFKGHQQTSGHSSWRSELKQPSSSALTGQAQTRGQDCAQANLDGFSLCMV